VGEDYVRPPLLGLEPPSPRAAAWRFRVILLLALLALIAGIVFAIRALVGSNGEGNPGVGLGGPRTSQSVGAS
jgi:hypothetical protein